LIRFYEFNVEFGTSAATTGRDWNTCPGSPDYYWDRDEDVQEVREDYNRKKTKPLQMIGFFMMCVKT
jgi:hypothetical protein